ncbi:MAG: hypothetical protein R3E01_29650 [Pirellulaceae bacterium]|nr:hypothetical protein [Planctomycetales bacterium]
MARRIAQGLSAAIPGQRYQFRLATARDEAELREVIRQCPMDGDLRVTLRREPNYFDAGVVEGPTRQTLVGVQVGGRTGEPDRIVGFGTRSVRPRFVDGEKLAVGYLSGLRILPQHRGGTLLARGYRHFRQLHGDGATTMYLTTIADGNPSALTTIAANRRGMPHYYRLGQYHTCVISARSRWLHKQPSLSGDLNVAGLQPQELPEYIDYLHMQGVERLFFPCYDERDFVGREATFRDLAWEDVLIARRKGRIVGSLALWDQRGFKQSVVEGYGGRLRWLRPYWNAAARIMRWPRFPDVGCAFESVIGALPIVARGEEGVLEGMISRARQHIAEKWPECSSLLLGVFERDRLFDTIHRNSLFRYVTHVYLVYWDDEIDPTRYAGRDIYLELGCL